MAKTKDISRKQGDTYPIEVVILSSPAGTPLDMTGATSVQMGISDRENLSSGETPLAVLTGTITTPAEGLLQFTVSNEARDLLPGVYYAEIQFIKSTYVYTTETFRYEVKGQIIR